MKNKNIVPNDQEKCLQAGRYIVSTTDPSGRITSVNDVFIEYSGYVEEELSGSQHNIVRHPDMPRTVFKLAWDALQAGEDFYGYIKNLCKDGGYYWVFAHIRPQFDGNGEISGYRSVRRAPKPSAVAAVEELYASMRRAEQASTPDKAIAAGLDVLRGFLASRGQSYEQMVVSL